MLFKKNGSKQICRKMVFNCCHKVDIDSCNDDIVIYLKKLLPSVRGLFAPTGHSFQGTDIWFSSFDPNF